MTQKLDKSAPSVNDAPMAKRFIMVFMATAITGLGLLWFACRNEKTIFMNPAMGPYDAHTEMEKKCDIGQLMILGDSTGTSDYLTEEIGPHVRTFSVAAGGPLENFYVMNHVINTCDNLPKSVILSFTPFTLSTMAIEEKSEFIWARFIPWHIISWSDALDALRTIRQYKDKQIFGMKSIFDIDAKLKILMYHEDFPAAFFPDLLGYFNNNFTKYDFYRREITYKERYHDTLIGRGHIFFGRAIASHEPDHEALMSDYNISKIGDQYLNRTVDLLKRHGIHIYFAAPPHNTEAVEKYQPDIIEKYVAYIQNREKVGDWQILGKPFRAVPPGGMGDRGHLNFHGAFWCSREIRQALLKTQDADLAWTDQQSASDNLYAAPDLNIDTWKETIPGGRLQMSVTSDATAPQTADPVTTPVVSLSAVGNKPGPDSVSSTIHSAPSTLLQQGSYYVSSIFIKNSTAHSATWHLMFPGGFDGSITWDFAQQQIYQTGKADLYNSGVEDCGNGWMRLWVRGQASEGKQDHAYSTLSVNGPDRAAMELYGASLERGLMPHNDCYLR